MGQDTIRLGAEQQRRAQVLNLLLAGTLTIRQAAVVLDRSERQVKRLKAAYRQTGPETLVHGNSGRVPRHALSLAIRTRVVELARGKYAGFNHQHLTEQLAEVEGVALGRTTVRRLLQEAGLSSPRPRRAPSTAAAASGCPRRACCSKLMG